MQNFQKAWGGVRYFRVIPMQPVCSGVCMGGQTHASSQSGELGSFTRDGMDLLKAVKLWARRKPSMILDAGYVGQGPLAPIDNGRGSWNRRYKKYQIGFARGSTFFQPSHLFFSTLSFFSTLLPHFFQPSPLPFFSTPPVFFNPVFFWTLLPHFPSPLIFGHLLPDLVFPTLRPVCGTLSQWCLRDLFFPTPDSFFSNPHVSFPTLQSFFPTLHIFFPALDVFFSTPYPFFPTLHRCFIPPSKPFSLTPCPFFWTLNLFFPTPVLFFFSPWRRFFQPTDFAFSTHHTQDGLPVAEAG